MEASSRRPVEPTV